MTGQQVTERWAQADARTVFGVPLSVVVLGVVRRRSCPVRVYVRDPQQA